MLLHINKYLRAVIECFFLNTEDLPKEQFLCSPFLIMHFRVWQCQKKGCLCKINPVPLGIHIVIQACNYTFTHYFFPQDHCCIQFTGRKSALLKISWTSFSFSFVSSSRADVFVCHRIYCLLTILAPVTESASSLPFQQCSPLCYSNDSHILTDLFSEHFSDWDSIITSPLWHMRNCLEIQV